MKSPRKGVKKMPTHKPPKGHLASTEPELKKASGLTHTGVPPRPKNPKKNDPKQPLFHSASTGPTRKTADSMMIARRLRKKKGHA